MDDERLSLIERIIHLLHFRIASLEEKLTWINEVLWVEKNEFANPYERITRLGGRVSSSSRI